MAKKNISKKSFHKIRHLKSTAIAISINIFIVALVLALNSFIPSQIPLYYGQPFGQEQLAGKYSLILPPLFSIAVISLNTSIIQFQKDKYLNNILVAMNYVLTILSTIAVFKIIYITSSLL